MSLFCSSGPTKGGESFRPTSVVSDTTGLSRYSFRGIRQTSNANIERASMECDLVGLQKNCHPALK